MSHAHPRILLVDDDELNLEVLVECLRHEPYELIQAHSGIEALDLLRHDPGGFVAMVLDRMMPEMSGLEVMTELKADENFKWIPVVMQTSAASPSEMCEGMEAGVFFYLTKPYAPETLRRMVRTAVEEGMKWGTIARHLQVQVQTLGCLHQGRFEIHTMDEAFNLALLIAQAYPNPDKVAFGLNELIMNGLEHGNLEIGYDEKTKLQEQDKWEDEIRRRQKSPQYAHKFVEILFERHSDRIQITVTDQGCGFDWRDYEEIKAERLLESHGRGIAMAKALSFDHMEYLGTGNQVVCQVYLNEPVGVQQGSRQDIVGIDS